jgi:hypothetical protein
MLKIPPPVWGPFFWHTIHIVAIGYPTNPSYAHKRAAKEFFEGLQFLLPCEVCRQHYRQHLQKMPITPHLDRREDLFRWTVELHNEVNRALGKPTLTEGEAIRYYFRIGNRGRSPVLTTDDFQESDTRSFIKGAVVGGGVIFVAGSLLWWSSTQKN